MPIWKKTEEELGAMGLPPPFWAFAWAGGQALARYVLDNPALVRGQARARFRLGLGPRRHRRRARRRGSGRGVRHRRLRRRRDRDQRRGEPRRRRRPPRGSDRADEGWDIVLAGDVAYEKDMARGVTDWLASLARRGATVLVGDPRRTYLALDRLESVIEYRVPVTRELEDSEIKRTGVFRFRSARGE